MDGECPSGFNIDDLKGLLVIAFGETKSDGAAGIAYMATVFRSLWKALRAVEVPKSDIGKTVWECRKVDIPDAADTNFTLGVLVGFASGDGEVSGSDGRDVRGQIG